MDSDTDMSPFARPAIFLDPPPPLESRFPKEHMPAVQRVQDNNCDGSSHKLSTPSPLSHEIRLGNKIPRATGIAVSGLARMKVKTRKAFARQIRTDLMQLHLSKKRNPNDTNNLKALQGQIEDLRDMFENLWVSSPRIRGWRMSSSSSSKTSKNSKHLRRTTKGGWPRHHGLAHRASRNRHSRSPLTRRELLASFVRTTSRRFQDQTMPKK
ncbi:hypothetical protein BGZ74_009708 [Mortierella antarctica]|nr:hypothetical protein BGZ74_009708 [Mortierella antarctica]